VAPKAKQSVVVMVKSIVVEMRRRIEDFISVKISWVGLWVAKEI